MSMELLDAVHDHRRAVVEAVHDVRSVANALHRVGWVTLADELWQSVKDLEDSADRVVHAHTLDVKGQISHGEKMIGGIMEAFMAGAIVVPEQPVKLEK